MIILLDDILLFIPAFGISLIDSVAIYIHWIPLQSEYKATNEDAALDSRQHLDVLK